jgi:hypothetical protein
VCSLGQDYINTNIIAVHDIGNNGKTERLAIEWQEDNLIPQEFWSKRYYSTTIQFPRIDRHGS